MILILIGGGNSSGKLTYAEVIQNKMQEKVPSLKFKNINLEKEYYKGTVPLSVENYQFEQLKQDLDNCDEDVVIIHGIYVLYNKGLRLKLSLKLFVDCDYDTRLTRFIQKNSPVTKDTLKDLISSHLLTRAELIGRVDSDIVIKTDAVDDTKNKMSVKLITNYLLDLLNSDATNNIDKGEINLREVVERFYPLN